MKLVTRPHDFFDEYLPHLKGLSTDTMKTYRDTFTLFLPFAAQYHAIPLNSLTLQDICDHMIIAFLDHLERERKCSPRTRNLRLATLKSFAKMIRLMYPEYKEAAEFILHIPQKRTQKNLVGFVTQEEMLMIFKSVNMKKNEGFRDYTILNLLFDSGARASELAALKRQIQKKITEHTQSPLKFDPKLEEALDWENSENTLAWLDSL